MLHTKKQLNASKALFIISFLAYTIISMSKTSYASAMVSIIGEGIFTKSRAGIISSVFYLTYGVMQLMGAKLVDKISPSLLIGIALLGSAVSTFLMSVVNSFNSMLIIWAFCGFVQFASWPTILRIIAEYILPEHRHKASIYIAFSLCAGNLINYILASFILKYFGWRTIFYVNTAALSVVLIIWCIISVKATKILDASNTSKTVLNPDIIKKNNTSEKELSTIRLLISSGLVFLLVPAFIRATLDTGLKAWVPTLIAENYIVSDSFATMLTAILLVVNLSGVFIANFIYPKYVKNATMALCLCFGTILPFTLLLLFTGKIHVLIVTLLLIFVTTITYAAHQFMNIIIPSFFNRYGHSGSVASIINSCASLGAVSATFGFGYIAEKFGWIATIASWSIFAVISVVFCLIAFPLWEKFTNRKKGGKI